MKKLTRWSIGCLPVVLVALGFSLGIGAVERGTKGDRLRANLFADVKKIVEERSKKIFASVTVDPSIVEKDTREKREAAILEYRKRDWVSVIDTVRTYVEEVSREKGFSGKDKSRFLQLLDDLKIRGSEFLSVTTELAKVCPGGGCENMYGINAMLYYLDRTRELETLKKELLGSNKKPDRQAKKRVEELKTRGQTFNRFSKKPLSLWLGEEEAWLVKVVNKGKEPQKSAASAVLLLIGFLKKGVEPYSCLSCNDGGISRQSAERMFRERNASFAGQPTVPG